MAESVDPFNNLTEQEQTPSTDSREERPLITDVRPVEEACFPVCADGMPKALKRIPANERSWYWRDMRYRGHLIAHIGIQDERHRYLFEKEEPRAFYVRAKDGTIGLVPFENSTVVWPHSRAWEQDLAPENQGAARPDLKPSERKKKR